MATECVMRTENLADTAYRLFGTVYQGKNNGKTGIRTAAIDSDEYLDLYALGM